MMKKVLKVLLIIIFVFALLIGTFIFSITKSAKNNENAKVYNMTQEEYVNAGGTIIYELPSEATNCTFYTEDGFLYKKYMYSFRLDEESYNQFISGLEEKYEIEDKTDDNSLYGYGKWYKMKVSECNEINYGINNFPVNMGFENVIDDNIEDYVILIYYPQGSFNSCHGMVVNEKTKQIVAYHYHTM